MIETHPNFKSINPNICNANDMFEYIGEALDSQHLFEIRTTPWEMDDKELQKFSIVEKYIDRIYHICVHDGDIQHYRLIARMDYKEQKHYYVNMMADCYSSCDFQEGGNGHIYVSGDANVFMNTVLDKECESHLIFKSLEEDGIKIDKYDTVRRRFWKNPPLLQYLCHEAVYENQNLLNKYYPQVLPKLLVKSVTDFMKIKKAQQDYYE